MSDKKFQTVVYWPIDKIDLFNRENRTTDNHYTEAEAICVLDRLKEKGFGGEGKIFPTKGFYRSIELLKPRKDSKARVYKTINPKEELVK